MIKKFNDFLIEKDIITRVRTEERGNQNNTSHAINQILITIQTNINLIRNKHIRMYLKNVCKFLDKY